MRALGSFACGHDWYTFTAPGRLVPECFTEYGQSFGAGRPWFVWSRERGNQRCIVDDFGNLVAV